MHELQSRYVRDLNRIEYVFHVPGGLEISVSTIRGVYDLFVGYIQFESSITGLFCV